jgi:DNA-binding beta-propeller fold protein YncE
VDVYLHISDAPLAIITSNFQNPVFVPLGDSVDVSINLANAGGSNLLWSASTAWQPMVLEKQLQSPVYQLPEILVNAEAAPSSSQTNNRIYLDAIWDLQFSFDVQIASGALGNAGAEFDGTYYYSTRWASNLLHKYDMTGTLVEEFSIPGVTGLRDLAFDGTYMYGGAAATTIYMMDFVTKTLIGTIPSPVAVRSIAYDSDNDGFWVANWTTDLVLVSRTGSTLATIPAATHGLSSMYGSAYDNWSDGGPYLWVFDQASTGDQAIIHQIQISTGLPTGVTHNLLNEFPASSPLAGGLFTAEGIVSGKVSLGGLAQGTPDMFFVYELTAGGPTWMKMMMTAGMVAPGDNSDMPMRIYGIEEGSDTAFVVIQTNDPAAPVINVEVHKTMVTGLEDLTQMPTSFDMAQNYPNPFNPTTTIKYQLPKVSDVKLVIYNILGQQVRTLLNGQIEAGYHSVVWDGRNETGQSVASGIYIYRFEAGDFQKTMKLLILR